MKMKPMDPFVGWNRNPGAQPSLLYLLLLLMAPLWLYHSRLVAPIDFFFSVEQPLYAW
jgi:hypothetical protein